MLDGRRIMFAAIVFVKNKINLAVQNDMDPEDFLHVYKIVTVRGIRKMKLT